MLIELEAVLAQVLPESGPCGAPFELKEITDVANKFSDKPVPHSRVYHAWASLYRSAATRELVAPIGDEKTILLTAYGARRVLRKLWNSKIPPKVNAPQPDFVIAPKLSRAKNVE